MSGPQPIPNPRSGRPVLNVWYVVGIALRVPVVTVLIVFGFELIGGFHEIDQQMRGVPIVGEARPWGERFHEYAGLAQPIAVVLLVTECQLFLLRLGGLSLAACQVLVPAALAAVGAFLGWGIYESLSPSPIGLRVVVFGTSLLFFLAGSFQVWFWGEWTRTVDLKPTPILWYAIAMCLAGGLFGSMIAWTSPSPYVREVLEYREERWPDDLDYPKLPTPQADDVEAY